MYLTSLCVSPSLSFSVFLPLSLFLSLSRCLYIFFLSLSLDLFLSFSFLLSLSLSAYFFLPLFFLVSCRFFLPICLLSFSHFFPIRAHRTLACNSPPQLHGQVQVILCTLQCVRFYFIYRCSSYLFVSIATSFFLLP